MGVHGKQGVVVFWPPGWYADALGKKVFKRNFALSLSSVSPSSPLVSGGMFMYSFDGLAYLAAFQSFRVEANFTIWTWKLGRSVRRKKDSVTHVQQGRNTFGATGKGDHENAQRS